MSCRNQFTFYKSFDDVYQDLSDKQKLEFMQILLDVQFLRVKVEDVVPQDTVIKHIWNAQKHTIQTSIKGYLESQKGNVKTPYLGIYDPLQIPSEGFSQQGKGKEQVKDKEEGKEQEKEKRFKKPTNLEVEAYGKEIEYLIDGNKFIDFYESKGWLIGKNKMKCWKSALRTWKSKDNPKKDDLTTSYDAQIGITS